MSDGDVTRLLVDFKFLKREIKSLKLKVAHLNIPQVSSNIQKDREAEESIKVEDFNDLENKDSNESDNEDQNDINQLNMVENLRIPKSRTMKSKRIKSQIHANPRRFEASPNEKLEDIEDPQYQPKSQNSQNKYRVPVQNINQIVNHEVNQMLDQSQSEGSNMKSESQWQFQDQDERRPLKHRSSTIKNRPSRRRRK